MVFDLHPDLAEWIDRESVRVASLVQDLTDVIPKREGLNMHPDHPIAARIGPGDIIGEIVASSVDVTGKIVARSYPHEDRTLGLSDGGMIEAQKLAERVWSRRELCNLLSRSTILDLLLEWVGSVTRGTPTVSLSGKIVQTVAEVVEPLSIWVPVDEIFVADELPFGTAVLAPLSRSELDVAIELGTSQITSNESTQWREKLYSKTSVEMLALRNENEPIQAALADRLAFAITKDPDQRLAIAQNLRAAYSIRSGRTHHGKTIMELRRSSSSCETLGLSFSLRSKEWAVIGRERSS